LNCAPGCRNFAQSPYNRSVPITVFDTKGVPATRREAIEAAVEAAGRHLSAPHEAWISADLFRAASRFW